MPAQHYSICQQPANNWSLAQQTSPAHYCRVLPPGDFNDMFQLIVYSESLMTSVRLYRFPVMPETAQLRIQTHATLWSAIFNEIIQNSKQGHYK